VEEAATVMPRLHHQQHRIAIATMRGRREELHLPPGSNERRSWTPQILAPPLEVRGEWRWRGGRGGIAPCAATRRTTATGSEGGRMEGGREGGVGGLNRLRFVGWVGSGPTWRSGSRFIGQTSPIDFAESCDGIKLFLNN
jgi:hypothetical protein